MQTDINILDQILPVEAPEIELTSISARAEIEIKKKLPLPILVSAFAGLFVLLLTNVIALNTVGNKAQQSKASTEYSYLINNNALYQ